LGSTIQIAPGYGMKQGQLSAEFSPELKTGCNRLDPFEHQHLDVANDKERFHCGHLHGL
jgi:hypothetical protein